MEHLLYTGHHAFDGLKWAALHPPLVPLSPVFIGSSGQFEQTTC